MIVNVLKVVYVLVYLFIIIGNLYVMVGCKKIATAYCPTKNLVFGIISTVFGMACTVWLILHMNTLLVWIVLIIADVAIAYLTTFKSLCMFSYWKRYLNK